MHLRLSTTLNIMMRLASIVENPQTETEPVADEDTEDAELRRKLDQGVEMIELSARAGNCLKLAGIRTVRELVSKTREDLLNVKNFGLKTLEEINEKIVEMGLSLGMKL